MESLFSTYAKESIEHVEHALNTSIKTGLSAQEAKERQKKYGMNLPPTEQISWWELLKNQVYSSFFLLFFLLALFSYGLGEELNAIIILVFLLINASVGFYQEFNAFKDLALLRTYLVHSVRVRRDEKEQEIASSELVPGDIILLDVGGILAADIRIVQACNLELDESAITGESVPALKIGAATEDIGLYTACNIGVAGSTVFSGKGLGIVFATAKYTIMNGNRSGSEEAHSSGLSTSTRQLSSFITTLILVATGGIFLCNILLKGFALDYPHLFLFSIAMAITITPQALPVVITFSLARGVKQLAKKNLLVKRLSCVEDLGAMEILCADADLIKATAFEDIKQAKKLGLNIKMLSGDTPEACFAVAKRVGLIEAANQMMSGDELEKLSAKKKEEAVTSIVLFCQVSPIQKHEIIQLLQKKNIVGYMGDGIYDEQALKIADVSIAAQNAVDVAYKAANVIILQKSLHVLSEGIEEGRTIITNTLKYVRSALTSNMGNFFSLFVASLVLDYLPMLPIQLLLLNLLSDFPMIAISTDSVDHHDLRTPKRYALNDVLFICIILALVSCVFDLIFFMAFKNFTPAVLQTAWFVESILTELVFIFCIRVTSFIFFSDRPSWPLVLLASCSMLFAIVLPQIAFTQELFGFVPLLWRHYVIIFGIVIAYFITSELVKVLYYQTLNNNQKNN